jgi:hypothetical protein
MKKRKTINLEQPINKVVKEVHILCKAREQALDVLEQLYMFSINDEVKDVMEFLDKNVNKELMQYLKESVKE